MAASDFLNLYLMTFNCGRTLINPTAFAPHLFQALDTPITTSSSNNNDASTSGSPAQQPDIIAFNLQEIAPIAYAFLGGSFLTPYYDQFRSLVDVATKARFLSDGTSVGVGTTHSSNYVNVLARNNGLTAIMVFVREELIGRISNIMTAEVGVGVQEMGNKGAVGVRIAWALDGEGDENSNAGAKGSERTVDVTFVSAHLAPMEEEVDRRNQDYKEIVRGLVFTSDVQSGRALLKSTSKSKSTSASASGDEHSEEGAPLLQTEADDAEENTTQQHQQQRNNRSSSTALMSTRDNGLTGIYTSDSHVFFAGDLNYRTNETPPSSAEFTSFPELHVPSTHSRHWSHLLPRDQLSLALSKGHTLHGMTEAKITFGPTYKYKYHPTNPTQQVIEDDDTKSWSWASHRWPSWCDRILYSAPPAQSSPTSSARLQPRAYASLPMLVTSDHRPVVLSVSVPLVPVKNPDFAAEGPIVCNPQWKARRDAARRKEVAVGIGSYLALMREGQAVLVASFAAVIGGWLIARGWSG